MTRFRTPSLAVLVGASVAAIHVLDDNFVEPGWQDATDHLASALVPIAALAVLALLSTRVVRTGSRALVSLVLGLLCLTFASEAIFHAATGSLAGDDWTGLLSAAAGAFLVGAALRDLWRSRRRDGSRWRRYGRRTLIGFATLFVAVQLAYPVVEAYAYSNIARRTVPTSELGVAHEDVSFRTTDGHLLQGWYVPSKNGAAVIVYPGRERIQRHARMLIANGYGVLLFDHRGVGSSEGEPNSWGWGSEHDVHGAIAYLQRRPDVEDGRIGALGLSVGGEVLLHAAAENDALRAVVSEGAGARSWKEYRKIDGAASWLWAPVAINRMVATSIFTNRMPPPGLHDLVTRIHVPVFFIHATQGIGGEALTEDYYRLANESKLLWKTDSAHTGGLDADPELYERRVVGFLDDALLD